MKRPGRIFRRTMMMIQSYKFAVFLGA
jgi:hypothetical protein